VFLFISTGIVPRADYRCRILSAHDRKARFRAAIAFCLRLTLGFSKYCRLRISESVPARSHCFLKRRRAISNGSWLKIFIPGTHSTPSCFLLKVEQAKNHAIT
jgi:hypothetical protein